MSSNNQFSSKGEPTVVIYSGTVEVATREHPGQTWGPPVYLEEERNK